MLDCLLLSAEERQDYEVFAYGHISLALSLHKSVTGVADCRPAYNIVTDKLSETLKQLTPVKPWGPKDRRGL